MASQELDFDDISEESRELEARAAKAPPTEIFSAEDIANSISHGIGLGLSVAGLVVLIVVGWMVGDPLRLTTVVIYGVSLVTLFAASTIYHSVQPATLRHIFRVLDHSAIYLLIAGTYTPITLVVLGGTLGWALFGVVWTMALVGVVYKIFWFGRFPGLSMALYLIMGWAIVVTIGPLWDAMPRGGFVLLFTGGLAYTSGLIFFAWHRLLFNHAIWHVFVLTAAICHYFMILLYILPEGI